MGRLAPRRVLAWMLAASACIALPATAHGDVVDDCTSAAEQSQPLRHDGKLTAAREKLLACVRQECPAVVRRDCARWLTEVEAAMPTIVVHATDASGADVADVRVIVDGRVVAERLEGTEMPLDPGPHTLRLEREGSPAVEQQIFVDEGEKARAIPVTFAHPSHPPPLPPTANAPSSEASPPRPPAPRRNLVLPVALIVAGAAGFGVSSYFWVTGLADRSTLQGTCAPRCSQSAIDSAHGKLVVGDVIAGVATLAVAAGVWLILSPPSATASSAAVGAQASGSDFRLLLRANF